MSVTAGLADLGFHGDAELSPGLLDAAVNVRPGPPPWLRSRLTAALAQLSAYPDSRAARAAVAARHGRAPEEVLLLAGAAQAFPALAQAVHPHYAVVVHPAFTAPELALRAAGHPVARVVLPPPFQLPPPAAVRRAQPSSATGLARPAGLPAGAGPPGQGGLSAGKAPVLDRRSVLQVPDEADLVVIGNPTNPTGVLHPADDVVALARPGRTLVVDEAFMDFVPGEVGSLGGRRDVPGLVVVRSLTKLWGLAGLRVGYLLADAATVARLAATLPPWPVSTPGCVALQACSEPRGAAAAGRLAARVARERSALADRLARLPGVEVFPSAANFLLVHLPAHPDPHGALRARGLAVRRGTTFPGLGPRWVRVSVQGDPHDACVVAAFASAFGAGAGFGHGGDPPPARGARAGNQR